MLQELVDILNDKIDLETFQIEVDSNFWKEMNIERYVDSLSRMFPEFSGAYQVNHFGYSKSK